MVYLDFRSLSLTGALQRVGRGSGRRLFPCSRRFTPTEPHRRHAARGPGADRHLVPYSHRFTLTEPHRCHAAHVSALGPELAPAKL